MEFVDRVVSNSRPFALAMGAIWSLLDFLTWQSSFSRLDRTIAKSIF